MEFHVNDYEVTYILRPNLEEADVDARSTAIGEIIKGQGGSVVAVEKLGRKRLAYEIADLREGNYVAMHYRSTGDASKELERLRRWPTQRQIRRRRPRSSRSSPKTFSSQILGLVPGIWHGLVVFSGRSSTATLRKRETTRWQVRTIE